MVEDDGLVHNLFQVDREKLSSLEVLKSQETLERERERERVSDHLQVAVIYKLCSVKTTCLF